MWKIKKDSIFNQNKDSEIEVFVDEGGVLAVWGAPASGKTLVATKIAKRLADQKKNVILVLCDTTAPMLPCIVSPKELEVEKSLGSILSATIVTDSLVKYNMITLKKNAHLTMIGMLKGENEYTYPTYTRDQAEEFINCLRDIAEYVVIDCSSYIANDILSAVSLMESDSVLRLVHCDLKSISYLSSQLPLLENSGFDLEKQYKVASDVKSYHGIEQMTGALGSIAFQLPHSQEIEEQYLSGNLLGDLSMKNSKMFRLEINKICKEVFGV